MLTILIPGGELFDEKTESFIAVKEQTLELEHSLLSLAKWESKWEKPFLSKLEKSKEETIDYIRAMTINRNVDQNVYMFLSNANLKSVETYIEAEMTATTFNVSGNSKPNRETITSELIYYWMITLNIPFECQKWHLNRLLTLIKVCNLKNSPPQKMSRNEILERNRALNASRRNSLGTKG